MSGVLKSIGKAFKKIAKAVVAVVAVVAVAAAVYFTAGVALSYFAPATAAALPGFASASGAGTGIFSTVATKVGLGAGLAKGAAAASVASGAASTGVLAGSANAVAGTSAFGTVGGSAAGSGVLSASGTALGATSTAAAGSALVNGVAPVVAQKAGMSLTEKLLIAQLGSQALGGVLAPSMSDQYTEARKFRGAYYGFEGGGPADYQPEPMGSYQPPSFAANSMPAPQNASNQPMPATSMPEPPMMANARDKEQDKPKQNSVDALNLMKSRDTPTEEIEDLFPRSQYA